MSKVMVSIEIPQVVSYPISTKSNIVSLTAFDITDIKAFSQEKCRKLIPLPIWRLADINILLFNENQQVITTSLVTSLLKIGGKLRPVD